MRYYWDGTLAWILLPEDSGQHQFSLDSFIPSGGLERELHPLPSFVNGGELEKVSRDD